MPEAVKKAFEVLQGLMNIPDLVIIAFLLVNCIFGMRHGLLGSIYGLAGKIAALAASVFAAKTLAPAVAEKVVMPIVGETFSRQAQLISARELLEGMRKTAEEAAASMAESAAYAMLLILFGVLFGWISLTVCKGLRYITKLTPLSILDSIAGGIAGAATGAALIAMLLIGIEWFAPVTYSGLGWLSPQKVADTLLLARFIDALPVAI